MGTAGAEEAEVKSPIGQDFCFLAFKLLIQFYNTSKLDLLAEAKLKENKKKKKLQQRLQRPHQYYMAIKYK